MATYEGMAPEKIILLLSNLPILAVGVYAAFQYHRLRTPLRMLAWFVFLAGIIQLAGVILWLNALNNMVLLHIYVPAGTVLLISFYHQVIGHYLPRWILPTLGISFLAFTAVNSLFFQGILSFNSNALTVQSVLVMILSLSTYNLLLQYPAQNQQRILVKGLTWINSGLFLYYSSNLLLFYFGEWLTTATTIQEFDYSWVLHAFFSTVMYVCFFIGLWKGPKH